MMCFLAGVAWALFAVGAFYSISRERKRRAWIRRAEKLAQVAPEFFESADIEEESRG